MKAALRALLMVLWLAAAQAQPLDLRYQPVTGGSISSIREVGAVSNNRALPQGASQAPVGVPTDVEQGTPVGAAVYLPLGPQSDKNWRFGAAGTAEMQAQFAQNAYEVTVVMDDGERRVFRPRDPSRFRVGQRVSVRAGELEPLSKDGS
jgi:outer membrane lipoprotein SlyB